MDPVSGVSAIYSTLSSVYLSGVICDIITCSHGSCVRCLCREFYSVVCVSVWCDLLYKYVFIWTLCQVYLPSGVASRVCISLLWPVTYVRVHLYSVSRVSAIRSTLWCVYLSGVTCDINKFSYWHCVRCFCHQVYPVECVSLWCDLWHKQVFILTLCQVFLPSGLPCGVCICLVWLLYNYVFVWTMCQVYLTSILPCRACISLACPVI
jgi:hypothetical protein